MQSVITGNLFQNFQIVYFGEKNTMPIGTCVQLLVKPVTVTGTHCSGERHLYAKAQETLQWRSSSIRHYQVHSHAVCVKIGVCVLSKAVNI